MGEITVAIGFILLALGFGHRIFLAETLNEVLTDGAIVLLGFIILILGLAIIPKEKNR